MLLFTARDAAGNTLTSLVLRGEEIPAYDLNIGRREFHRKSNNNQKLIAISVRRKMSSLSGLSKTLLCEQWEVFASLYTPIITIVVNYRSC